MSTIHLISHTHWDREWYLTFQQFRFKLVQLIDHLLEILESDPDFKYFLLDGQTILLEDYLQIRPDKEPELIQLISAGRILIGPWYISPDEFLVAPESHIRNLLEGDRLCRSYGGKMMVGYLPDSFGHIGQMPQILQGFNINTACLWRGLGDQPSELLWRAPDGSSVLLAYLRDSYSNATSLTTSNPDKFANEVYEHCLSLSPYSISEHIILMHGTDHMEPPADLTSALHTYQARSHPDKLIHSNLPKYFEGIRSHLETTRRILPEVIGELRSSKRAALLQNILSTRIWLKQRNHACESDLLKWVEPLSAWVNLIDQTQPTPAPSKNKKRNQKVNNSKSIIHYAWKLLMQCHPHDSICGTSIDQVAKEMGNRFDQVDQINHDMISQNLQNLSEQIDTTLMVGTTRPDSHQDILSSVVVFNPNDSLNTGTVSIKFKLDKGYSSIEVIDDSGNTVPLCQSGIGRRELISMVLDKKGLKQALGMINEGNVAGMVIRDFEIQRQETRAIIQATISDHGQVDLDQWRRGLLKVEALIADPEVKEYFVRANSDPEISLSLIAHDVPGYGYRSYWVRGKAQQNTKAALPTRLNPFVQALIPVVNQITRLPIFHQLLTRKKAKPVRSTNRIENEYLIVEIQPADGTLAITDKLNRQVYYGSNRFIDDGDCGDLYNYCPPIHDQKVASKIKSIDLDSCEIYQRFIIHYQLLIPRSLSDDRKCRSRQIIEINLESEITLIPGVPRVDICTLIDNQATDHRLRVHFPAPFETKTSWHDGHYEIVQRPIERPNFDETWEEPPRPEVPQREFTSIANDQISLTIANRGLPEIEVFINEEGHAEIALTLLRCVGWLSRDDITTRKSHAGPMGIETPEAQMQGKYKFEYSIVPGGQDWHKSIHQAQAFNTPMRAIGTTIHSGTLPHKSAMIENQNKDFIITAIKLAEDDTSLIVRGFNIISTPIDVSIKPWRPFKHAQLVSLDEKIISNLTSSQAGQVNIRVDGHKITTFRFSD